MDLSKRALQSNEKLFSNFKLVFILTKHQKYSNEERFVNMDQFQIAILCVNGFGSTSSTN